MIQVIDRTFDILEFLGTECCREFTLSEISEEVGLRKTTCANILKSLVSRGYVEHHGKMRGYCLGLASYRLVDSPAYYEILKSLASESLDSVFRKVGETAILAVVMNGRRIVVSQMECLQGITARIRHSSNLYSAATGRVLMAFSLPKEINATIGKIGLPDRAEWPEVTSPDELQAALSCIRDRGYAVVVSQYDIVGIAVPVFKCGKAIASLGVCVPKYRCDTVRQAEIRSVLMEAAAFLSDSLA